MSSATTRIEQALCLGPSCARCLKVCPGDAVGHWSRDWEACDPHRSPHGFPQLSDHVARIIAAPTPEAQKELVRSEDSFNLWQSILRGAGVITGCRKCADVCPVGADYQSMLQRRARRDPATRRPPRSSVPPRMEAGRARRTACPIPMRRSSAGSAMRGSGPERCSRCRNPAPRSSAIQSKRKRHAVEQAKRAPFYAGKLDHIDSDRLDDADEWRKIPILTKDMLRSLSDGDFYDKFCVKPDDGIAEFWRSGGATGAPLFYPRSFDRHPLRHGRLLAHLSVRGMRAGRTRACVVSARHPSGRARCWRAARPTSASR